MSGTGSFFAPRLDESPLLVEVNNATVSVAVGDENVAIWEKCHVGRAIEVTLVTSRLARFTKRQQELLREFEEASEAANNHHPESNGFFAKVRELWDDLTD